MPTLEGCVDALRRLESQCKAYGWTPVLAYFPVRERSWGVKEVPADLKWMDIPIDWSAGDDVVLLCEKPQPASEADKYHRLRRTPV